MGGSWEKPNTDSEPGKARWLAKGDREEMLRGIQTIMRAWLSLNPPMCLFTCTAFPPNKHFASSTSRFMGIHFYRTSGPGSCHWQLLLWPWWPSGLVVSALIAAWLQSLAGNWNPASSHCRHLRSVWPHLNLNTSAQTFFPPIKSCSHVMWVRTSAYLLGDTI